MDIKTSRILLIGATGGIGQAIAMSLHTAGAGLLLTGRNSHKLQTLLNKLQQQEQKHRIVSADITTSDGRKSIIDAVNQYPAGINVVINCAGINNFSLFEEMGEKKIDEIIDSNLVAPLQIIRLLLPHLKQHKQAHIINIGSTFGSIGFPGFTVYCASKFALRGFSESLRRELADTGVKVTYVAPRATDTELNTSAIFSMNRELKIAMDKPDIVAAYVLKVLQSGEAEIYIGWPEKLFIKLNNFLPRLVNISLKKQLPIIKRYANQTDYLN